MGSCGTLGGSPLAAVERSEINVSRGHMGVCLSSSAGFATIVSDLLTTTFGAAPQEGSTQNP